MGHAMCLGIVLQQHQYRKDNESTKLVPMANLFLKEMCFRDIDAGVDVYVGADDPGFTGSTFVEKARFLWDVAD
eukprot:10368015-Ditylum_brightwellii.AAC.1